MLLRMEFRVPTFKLLMSGDGQVVLMASCFRREAHVASGLAGDFVTVLTQ